MNPTRIQPVTSAVTRRDVLVLTIGACLVGCGGSQGQVPPELQSAMMLRWNAVAQGVTVEQFNFRWDTFDQFPHPTFKGGSMAAYQRFADLLVAFYEKDDDFDFLAKNKLFGAPLRYVFPSGQVGVDTNFAQLTADLSTNPLVSSDTAQKLKDFDSRIRAAL
jgi:hypothetical protein